MTLARWASGALLALVLGWHCLAIAEVSIPTLSARVTDQTATLSAEQTASLEQTLQAFEARKGSQVAVLIVASTLPESIEQYSLRVVEQWKLGRKKIDDGVLLIVAKDDRALRIEVGYGLEGALTDAASKRIVSEVITPHFKHGEYFAGIVAGVAQIIRVIDGESLPEPAAEADRATGKLQQYVPVLFIIVLALGGLLRAVLGQLPGAAITGGIVAVIAWFLVGTLAIALLAGVLALIFTLMGGGRGGVGMGGFPGGFGGGPSGGGFGGGGGGFGGGGASGRW